MATKSKAAALVTVKVVSKVPVGEPGGPYLPGSTFNTTEERAEALGEHQVKIIGQAPASEADAPAPEAGT